MTKEFPWIPASLYKEPWDSSSIRTRTGVFNMAQPLAKISHDLGLNLGRCNGKPVINGLCCSIAAYKYRELALQVKGVLNLRQ
jgi:hypothetical protein